MVYKMNFVTILHTQSTQVQWRIESNESGNM